MTSVIVFGPTGNVASIVAQTAQKKGAQVFLAMRDPSKTIPGLSSEDEKAGGYTRVQADLSKPDSVAAAVKKSGATRAFFYLAFGTDDHMKATLEAMKSAGIESVVFLSSSSIYLDTDKITPDLSIPWIHAQVELNLDQVFGKDNYVAIRPGRFATNITRNEDGIKAGKVKTHGLSFLYDFITPQDMGEASGTILANGPKDGDHIVHLYGPQIITQQEGIAKVGKVFGKDLQFENMTDEEGIQLYAHEGMPPPVAKFLVEHMGGNSPDPEFEKKDTLKKGQENVVKYTGRPATTIEQWAKTAFTI